ncbi:NADH-quinone oxidoreductase subunit L [Thiomonas bhubaneswarensis]|uniref:Probable inorganic carbon transporter subunit DabB n=1 Tax=Thiomonas bhubaneswarensis TaxID=339866 RepID=A0A0K6HT64_9BURK|nr:NADH-quinone oxidoreductase subunit L [Thiomonas bhubaneswarensis]CUA93978.1 NADH:ubiquinone oxidoreductase subunit 5 (chain L)/Multisubunit Na+/H+ antiporter, MnhA subunit [Thiomonas bhubaneswarensis]
MTDITPAISPAIGLVPPAVLWLAGLVGSRWAAARPSAVARLNTAAAWAAFAAATGIAAIFALKPPVAWTAFSIALPGDVGAFSLSVYLNAVTLVMLLLVSFVGVIVSRYARTYLDREVGQGRFHLWLMWTLASILTLIVSGNLLLFALAWMSTSLCLHQLLTFYRERPAAMLAAHKKFVASRIGDAALLLAVLLIGSNLHTLELPELYARLAAPLQPLPLGLQAAALLVVVSAALKSAQFPLHGWLIQVMEAPTPVSALLHAGIVNAGAFLVLRMSPLMSQSGLALAVLALIGLTTLALASLVMLTQTSIKVSLAWSTTAQMGFMLLECGLGLYSLAMLHLVAHSLYKAHAFLASGSGVDGFRAPVVRYSSSRGGAMRTVGILAVAAAVSVSLAATFGLDWRQEPALIAAAAIVSVATAQLLLQTTAVLGAAQWLRAVGLAAVVCSAYYLLHAAFDMMLRGSVLPLQPGAAAAQAWLVPLVIALFLLLLGAQRFIASSSSALRRRLWVHLYNGLYIDVAITRLLQRAWPSPTQATPQTASHLSTGA